jgi:hypothetical protein
MSKICEGCWKWDEFGKTCNIYWEDKSVCTQWQSNPKGENQYVGKEILGVGL